MECSIVLFGFHGIHIGPAIKQQLDRLDATNTRGYHECRLPPCASSRGRHVFQQEANNVRICFSTRDNESIFAYLSLQDETAIEQQAHNLQVSSLDGTAHRTPTKISGVLTLHLNRHSLIDQTHDDINLALIASVT